MISLLWTLLIIAIVCGLVWWLIGMITPSLGAGFPVQILRIIFAVLVVILIIAALIGQFRVPFPGL